MDVNADDGVGGINGDCWSKHVTRAVFVNLMVDVSIDLMDVRRSRE